jgi:predicted amidohydrolase
MGVQVATVASTEGIAVADLLPERVAEVRKAIPSLQHRRFDITPRR